MGARSILAVAALAAILGLAPGAGPAAASPAEPAPSLGDARILHVLNRAGYGPRPGDVERIRAMGLEKYVMTQLHPEGIDDADCEARLAGLDRFRLSATELTAAYSRGSPEERKQHADDLARLEELRKDRDADRREIRELQGRVNEYRRMSDRFGPLAELGQARLIRAVHSERQLHEAMVDFWFNHFNVFARKGAEPFLIPEFEETVLRPHALGRFEDLLGAVAKSPAMLYYLDNFQSFAPEGAMVMGPGGRMVELRGRGAGGRGLNENYARELLELHTLGVDGGYDQADVIEVARCFTGWSLVQPGRRPEDRVVAFQFRANLHDAGEKRVLGRKIAAGGGMEDGLTVLAMLARHPSTARFLSEKLCRRFVFDDPPKALVERCARTYLASDGDVRLVLRTILTSKEFFAAAGTKMKTPFEFAASALRAVGAETSAPRTLLQAIGRLGEPLYFCEPPTGFPDEAEEWSGSNAVLARANFAAALAAGRLPGVKSDARQRLAESLPADDPAAAVDRVARALLGRPLSDNSRAAAVRAIEAARRELATRQRPLSPEEAVVPLATMVLGSPDFQMQ